MKDLNTSFFCSQFINEFICHITNALIRDILRVSYFRSWAKLRDRDDPVNFDQYVSSTMINRRTLRTLRYVPYRTYLLSYLLTLLINYDIALLENNISGLIQAMEDLDSVGAAHQSVVLRHKCKIMFVEQVATMTIPSSTNQWQQNRDVL